MANEMKKAAPFGMKDKVGYMFGDFGNDLYVFDSRQRRNQIVKLKNKS